MCGCTIFGIVLLASLILLFIYGVASGNIHPPR